MNVSWKESTLRRDMRLYRSGTGTTRSFPSSWETETEITWFLASPSLLKTRTSDTPVTSQLALRIPSPAPSSGSLILILKETSDAGELSLSDEVHGAQLVSLLSHQLYERASSFTDSQ